MVCSPPFVISFIFPSKIMIFYLFLMVFFSKFVGLFWACSFSLILFFILIIFLYFNWAFWKH
jgi:hypothetical protein